MLVADYTDSSLQSTDSVNVLTKGVTYVNTKTFRIEEGITNFKATINGTEYAYTCDTVEKTCTKKPHLQIEAVNAVVAGIDAQNVNLIYNGKSIEPTLSGNDVININIKRDMSTNYRIDSTTDDWFGVIVKFNTTVPSGLQVNIDGVATDTVKIRTGSMIDKYLTAEQVKEHEKYALLWIHSVKDAGEQAQKVGETKTQIVELKDGDVNHVLTINTTRVANSTDLKAVSARKVATDNGNSVINAMTNLAYNQEAIQKVEVVNGIIKVHVNKSIANTGSSNGFRTITSGTIEATTINGKRYIAILADLNNKTETGVGQTYAKENFDAKDSETLIWLEVPADTTDTTYTNRAAKAWNTEDGVYCYEISFQNHDPENKENVEKIKVEIIDESEKLELNVDSLNANNIPKEYKMVDGKPVEFDALVDETDVAGYKFNQANFVGTYATTNTDNTLTINPVKEGVNPLSYTRNRSTDDTSTANYVAFRVDFGTEVTRVDGKDGIGFEKSEGTSYILYVALNNGNIKGSGETYTFKSTYDDSQVFTLKVVYDASTVKTN